MKNDQKLYGAHACDAKYVMNIARNDGEKFKILSTTIISMPTFSHQIYDNAFTFLE